MLEKFHQYLKEKAQAGEDIAEAEKLAATLSPDKMPKHIAIIMDGNGRWAIERGLPRVAGHYAGVNTVREIVRACGNLGIDVLTLYTFSTENWQRPREEVNALMLLLSETIKKEVPELHKEGVKLQVIGRFFMLPKELQEELNKGMELTKNNKTMILNLAINYGGRTEIVDAATRIANQVKGGFIDSDKIDETLFSQYLYTAQMPDPDLLIRTAGEMRISNFLLWQIAYTELWVTSVYWPDFKIIHLLQAIKDFQGRERRFGAL